ncbi:MAG: penicillin-binding protein 1C [Candidatus Poribacteria bacterium]|nr:penicillin-binding protein 1C [Candidatus Poribacteria bacterium]
MTQTILGAKKFKRPLILLTCFIVVLSGLILLVANRVFPLPVAKLHPPSSTVVLDRHGEWLRAFTASNDSWRIPEPSLNEISPKLRMAALTYEDRWFYYHFGINPLSIAQALVTNIKARRIVRGGSTITMQVARMMKPKPRTIRNKIIEMFRALQIEARYSKDEILTLYLNMAPYGGNIVGSSAASRIYFNKPQNRLSLGEAALLAAIPNSPTYLRPDLHHANAVRAREKVLKRMVTFGRISDEEFREANSEPIPAARHPMPFSAPHVTRLLKNSHSEPETERSESSHFFPSTSESTGAAGIRVGRIHSTIDARIQELAERILQESLAPLRREGISTGAIIVMDTKSREVLALVGSYRFFDQDSEGQVDGTNARRSPGSTLKPFIFGLAIDRGLITPESLLNDVPIDYSGYKPVNYDGEYRGYVTASDALAHSLNVPAVNLYARLRNDGIYSFLHNAGISTLPKAKEYYGLSLTLGGCELTLLELTTLYAGLANHGEFSRYRLTMNPLENGERDSARATRSGHADPSSFNYPGSTSRHADNSTRFLRGHTTKRRLLSREACYILTDMLSEVRRPDLPAAFEASANLPKIAWKTGTSFGHRDAWSIGYTPEYAIGVWVGNFDGTGVASLVGSEIAAPILFNLFTALTTPASNRWFARPGRVNIREVCSLSGMLPSSYCTRSKHDYFIPSVSPNTVCTIHKGIYIDERTGASLCSHCRVGRTYRRTVFEEWPAAIGTWLKRNGSAIPQIPSHLSTCTGLVAGHSPIVISPAQNSEYQIRSGIPLEDQKISLQASVSNRTKRVFWFLDGQLIFSGDPAEKVFLTPVVGKHRLTCIDDEGRSTSQTLIIRG